MPRRHDNLFGKIANFGALYAAVHRAVKGQAEKGGYCGLMANLEPELLRLERELTSGRYLPGRYTVIEVREPKSRRVSAAPFRDRVVHYALCAVVVAIFAAGFITHTSPTARVKGT